MSVRFATYNVRYLGIDEKQLAWTVRRDAVTAAIRAIDPDLLALQEVWLGQLSDLRSQLPYGWVAHADDSGPHTPIAYRRDRFSVTDQGAFGLAPGRQRGVLGWDAAYPRTVTYATLTDRHTGRWFTFVSVHLDHEGRVARREGTRVVCDWLPDGPVVVAGDCNCTPGTPPYQRFTAELSDTAVAARDRTGPQATYVGFDGTTEPRRLDYLFSRGWTVTRHHVFEPDGVASDHRPVVADCSFE